MLRGLEKIKTRVHQAQKRWQALEEQNKIGKESQNLLDEGEEIIADQQAFVLLFQPFFIEAFVDAKRSVNNRDLMSIKGILSG